MNNCPCPTDIVPAAPCCPNTIDLGSTIEVRDKDCNPRRIVVNGSGVLAARSNKAGMMDGSAARPLTMDFETFPSADGYVLLQDPGGRVIAVKPNVDLTSPNALLQFVYQDGAFKLVPITHDNLFEDSNTPSSAKGIMAMIACGGPEGLIKLGKFVPFPQALTGGPWPIVVDKDNQVFASKKAINEIPATDSVDALDLLLGSVDGKWKTIIPVKDKTIIGVETAGKVSWKLGNAGGIDSVSRTNIFTRSNDNAAWPSAGTDSSTINIATLVGYLAEYKWALLHFRYWIATNNYSIVNNISVEGRTYCTAATNINVSSDADSNSAIVPIPTAKTWNVVVATEASASGPDTVTGKHRVDIWIDGWMK